MKIAVVIDNELGAGGGFDQALNACLQIKKLSEGKFELIVFSAKKSNIQYFESLGIISVLFKYSYFDKFLSHFSGSILLTSLQAKLKLLGPFERKLLTHNVDIVYFVTPSIMPMALQKLNFITTVWDLSHRDSPEFPEVRNYGEFITRENRFKHLLNSAYIVITDSSQLSDLAYRRYGVDRERMISMPFNASPLLSNEIESSFTSISNKYRIASPYLYYPAQLWPHKNHIRIFEALKILKEEYNYMPTLILTGKDYGNLKFITHKLKLFNIESQVKVLGFLPSAEITTLYKHASAIIMPTYFGQTNLPPLEAWIHKVPLLYSNWFAKQVGDAAILIDPDDETSIVSGILKLKSKSYCDLLVTLGTKKLHEIEQSRLDGESKLLLKLTHFHKRLSTWK